LTYTLTRPRLPSPHQVAVKCINDLYQGAHIASLVYHGWVTLSATLLGFVIGTTLGVLLAVGIVYNARWIIRDRGRSHHKPFPFLRWLMIIVMLLGAIGIQDFCQIIISPPI
jgi:NitT/TauT family transport system permease protein